MSAARAGKSHGDVMLVPRCWHARDDLAAGRGGQPLEACCELPATVGGVAGADLVDRGVGATVARLPLELHRLVGPVLELTGYFLGFVQLIPHGTGKLLVVLAAVVLGTPRPAAQTDGRESRIGTTKILDQKERRSCLTRSGSRRAAFHEVGCGIVDD